MVLQIVMFYLLCFFESVDYTNVHGCRSVDWGILGNSNLKSQLQLQFKFQISWAFVVNYKDKSFIHKFSYFLYTLLF